MINYILKLAIPLKLLSEKKEKTQRINGIGLNFLNERDIIFILR